MNGEWTHSCRLSISLQFNSMDSRDTSPDSFFIIFCFWWMHLIFYLYNKLFIILMGNKCEYSMRHWRESNRLTRFILGIRLASLIELILLSNFHTINLMHIVYHHCGFSLTSFHFHSKCQGPCSIKARSHLHLKQGPQDDEDSMRHPS